MLPLWYYVVGFIVAIIVLLICLGHSGEEDRRLKAKQLAIWAIVFILSGALWPIVVLFGFLAVMGDA